MSKVRADNLTNRADNGAPVLTYGAQIPVGVAITGAGSVNIAGVVTASQGSFSGNVSIGGTLTYEDVTNINSVGVITAQSGINVTTGGINAVGVVTATRFVGTALSISGISTIADARLQSVSEDIQVGSGNTVTIDFTGGDGNIGFIDEPTGPMKLEVTNIPTSNFSSKSLSFTVVALQTSTAYACTAISFNGTDMTIRYSGGTVSTGNTNSIDYFNFVGIDTVGNGAIASYTVTSNVSGDYRLY